LSFAKKIELLFHKKTSFCKHKSPDCITNSVHGFISNFKIGLKIRVAFTLLQVLLRRVKINKISIVDQIRFPCFLALFAFISKLVLCVLRRFRNKDDGINGFLSGFIAGFSLLVHNDKGTKKMFALYLMSRAYGAIHNSLESRGLPKMHQQQHVLFILATNVLFTWLYFCELNKSINVSFYAALNNVYTVHKDKNDHIMRDLLQKRLQYFK